VRRAPQSDCAGKGDVQTVHDRNKVAGLESDKVHAQKRRMVFQPFRIAQRRAVIASR
jgi:hypothetical protein